MGRIESPQSGKSEENLKQLFDKIDLILRESALLMQPYNIDIGRNPFSAANNIENLAGRMNEILEGHTAGSPSANNVDQVKQARAAKNLFEIRLREAEKYIHVLEMAHQNLDRLLVRLKDLILEELYRLRQEHDDVKLWDGVMEARTEETRSRIMRLLTGLVKFSVPLERNFGINFTVQQNFKYEFKHISHGLRLSCEISTIKNAMRTAEASKNEIKRMQHLLDLFLIKIDRHDYAPFL